MKNKYLLLFIFFPISCLSQKLPDFGINRIRITQPDKIVLAETDPVATIEKTNIKLFYYWYSANTINMTQGGYSGKLLNGPYNEYYLNKNLKEQGTFKKGLKDGIWKSWNTNGKLLSIYSWKSGKDVTGQHTSIWTRLNIFKKTVTTDTSKNP